MRTLILLCVVALVAAGAMAFAVGLVGITTDHPEGRYVVNLTINTSMIYPATPTAEPNSHNGVESTNDNLLEVKGKITAVRVEKSELVLSENVKNWTFQLAKDGRVYLNDRESRLADLKPGDEAAVTFDRQGQQLFATVVHSIRK